MRPIPSLTQPVPQSRCPDAPKGTARLLGAELYPHLRRLAAFGDGAYRL